MALYPSGQWRPLAPGHPADALTQHEIICLHTIQGSLKSAEITFRDGGWTGVESHFGIGGPTDEAGDGTVYQWVDTDYQADANYAGNHRIVSIETSDGGDPTLPWSAAQLDAIVDVIAWCCHQHGVPPDEVENSLPGRRGIAYHRLGIDPWRVPGGEKWSKDAGKVCPGPTRIAQVTSDVVPRVRALLGQAGPTVTSVTPDVATTGDPVVLDGTGLAETTGVFFGGVWAQTWWIDDDAHLTATVPAPEASGPVEVGVVTDAATSTTVAFTYLDP